MPDRRVYRLNRPAGYDLSNVGQFEIGLVIAGWSEQRTEVDLVLIETPHAVGKACVDDAGAKTIVRSVRYHPAKYNSAVYVEVDQILIRRTYRSPCENRYAAVAVAAAWAIELLVDDSVNAVVATM
jgi:hypothetical protein